MSEELYHFGEVLVVLWQLLNTFKQGLNTIFDCVQAGIDSLEVFGVGGVGFRGEFLYLDEGIKLVLMIEKTGKC